eukprot:g5825.t1
MASNPHVISASESVHAASLLMSKNRLSAIVILDSNRKVVGILSEKDLCRFTVQHFGSDELDVDNTNREEVTTPSIAYSTKVTKVMTRRPMCATVSGIESKRHEEFRQIMQTMQGRRFRHMPIVDSCGRFKNLLDVLQVSQQLALFETEEAEALAENLVAGKDSNENVASSKEAGKKSSSKTKKKKKVGKNKLRKKKSASFLSGIMRHMFSSKSNNTTTTTTASTMSSSSTVLVSSLILDSIQEGTATNGMKQKGNHGRQLHCLLPPSATVTEALSMMLEQRSSAVLVVQPNTGKLVGIFTERDLVSRVLSKDLNPKTTRIGLGGPLGQGVMTANPFTVEASSSVSAALELLISKKFRHLPVVNKKGCAVGLLDILQITTQFFQKKAQAVIEEEKTNSSTSQTKKRKKRGFFFKLFGGSGSSEKSEKNNVEAKATSEVAETNVEMEDSDTNETFSPRKRSRKENTSPSSTSKIETKSSSNLENADWMKSAELGDARLLEGDFDAAITLYTKAINFTPSPPPGASARLLLRRANARFGLMRLEESQKDFENVLELCGKRTLTRRARNDALCGLAEIFTKKGMYEAAGIHLAGVENDADLLCETAAATLHAVAAAAKGRGNAEYSAHNFSAAMSCYTNALRANRALRAAFDKKGKGEDDMSLHGTHLTDFDHICFSNRAACYQQLGDHPKAIEDCVSATTLTPSYVKGWRRLCSSYSHMKKWSLLLSTARNGLENCPNDETLSAFEKQALEKCSSRDTECLENTNTGNTQQTIPTAAAKRASVSSLAALMRQTQQDS